jgi:hypothetical protein
MRGLASAAPPGGPAPAPAAAHRPAGGCPGPTRPLPRPRAGPAFPRPPLPSAHFLPHAPRPRPAAAICTRDEVRSPEVPPPRLEPPSRGRGGAPGAPAPRPGRVRRRGASGCVSGCSSNQLACTRCPKGRPSPGGSRRPAACARLLGGGCAIVSRVRLKLVLLFCAVPVVVALLAWPPWMAGRGSPGALATERPAGEAAPRGAQAAILALPCPFSGRNRRAGGPARPHAGTPRRPRTAARAPSSAAPPPPGFASAAPPCEAVGGAADHAPSHPTAPAARAASRRRNARARARAASRVRHAGATHGRRMRPLRGPPPPPARGSCPCMLPTRCRKG